MSTIQEYEVCLRVVKHSCTDPSKCKGDPAIDGRAGIISWQNGRKCGDIISSKSTPYDNQSVAGAAIIAPPLLQRVTIISQRNVSCESTEMSAMAQRHAHETFDCIATVQKNAN